MLEVVGTLEVDDAPCELWPLVGAFDSISAWRHMERVQSLPGVEFLKRRE